MHKDVIRILLSHDRFRSCLFVYTRPRLLLVCRYLQEEQVQKREQELLLEKEQREIKLSMMLQILQVQLHV